METAKQNTQQNIEENDALKQFMGLLNRQGMGEQSQDLSRSSSHSCGKTSPKRSQRALWIR